MTREEYQKELERVASIILKSVTVANGDFERILNDSVGAFAPYFRLDPIELKELVLQYLKPDETERKIVRIEDCAPWANQAIIRSRGTRLKAYKESLYRQDKIVTTLESYRKRCAILTQLSSRMIILYNSRS